MSAVAHSERQLAPVRAERRTATLAAVLGLAMLAATCEIVIDAASGKSGLVPKSPHIAGWLSSIGEPLGYRVFYIALVVCCGSYAGLVLLVRRASTDARRRRWAIRLVVLLHLIIFVGPILISTDVFSYIAYARMGVLHGQNPYLHGPSVIKHDAVFPYVGGDWYTTATAYGPLYTLLSYPAALLGIVGAVWAMKLAALLASAGTLALTWRCATARGFDPVSALLIVGANPLYVIYGLGGAHNDLLMMLAMMAGVAVVLTGRNVRGREAVAGAAFVAGALIKVTVGVLLPFMIVSRRRLAPVLGALAVAVPVAAIAYAVFGIHGIDLVAALNRDSSFVSTDGFATEIAHLLGKPGVFPVDHDILKGALVLIVAHLLWRTWRGYDWIAASGWALLAISVTSTWLLAWYVLWPLPLAVIVRDRRLLVATLVIQGLFIIHQLSPLLVPVQ